MPTSTIILSLALLADPADASGVGATAVASPPKPVYRRFGGFVGLDWRVMGLGGHVSNGPGFSAGAIFFDHLALGIAGFARPGPINPWTFDYELPDTTTYRGRDTLRLRSDGSVIGLLVAPFHDLRRAPLSVEVPVLLGYGGFGFYLHDQDRDVPDDRRVSEWENELLDGRDSDPVNLVVDVGLHLAIRTQQKYMRPYIGVHYTWVTGFSTAIRDNYDGFSGVVGVKFGKFPDRRRSP